jgi:hypothetical protein|tara:strand:+ start:1795 stop:2724 length:930 start_codon:yes stop_codon:yes gene_type:complete
MAITKLNKTELFDLSTETGAIKLPVGTSAQRPTSPTSGEWRFNSDNNKVEFWDGNNWFTIDDEADVPLEANQILWLDANNSNSWTGSGTTWYDLSPNNYDATIVTPVPSTGTVNGATYLDLSSRADYFQIPSSTHGGALSLKSGNTLTYLFWMRMTSIPTGTPGLNAILYGNDSSGNTQASFRYYYPSPGYQGFNFYVYDSSGNADVSANYVGSVTTSDWFMFVGCYDFPNNQWSINRYQPGQSNYNNSLSTTVSPQYTTDTDINFLSDNGGPYGGYGYLGEIRAYDTVFTATELDAKYDAQKGKYGIT